MRWLEIDIVHLWHVPGGMRRFPYLGLGLPETPFAVPATTGTTSPEPSVFDGTPSSPYLLKPSGLIWRSTTTGAARARAAKRRVKTVRMLKFCILARLSFFLSLFRYDFLVLGSFSSAWSDDGTRKKELVCKT